MGSSSSSQLVRSAFFIFIQHSTIAKAGILENVNVKTDEFTEKIHKVDSVDLLIYLILLSLAIITTWVFKKKRFKYLHESGVSILLGLVVGAILRFTGSNNSITSLDVFPQNQLSNRSHLYSPPDLLRMNISGHVFTYIMAGPQGDILAEDITDIQEKATFDPEIFFYMILPPIIFNTGYSMRKKHFFSNIGSILTFAFLGTVISTLVIACIMWVVVQLISTPMRFLDTLYFGAIVSATDPVTTLAIFNDINVDPMLNGLVLGESLLNDAVAIVLVGALEDYSKFYVTGGDPDSFEAAAFLKTIISFFSISLGSVGLGSLIGIITALLTKFTHVRDYPILETSLFFLLSYSSYLLAEICSMSGIVSVLFCGILQAHYTFHNLSAESKTRTRQLFELINFLMENFIFSYIGVSMFTFSRHRFQFVFIIGSVLAIGVARAFNIYPLSFLLNFGRKRKIPMNYQHMLWFSGLRGALAFALAIKNTVSEARQIILTTTSMIAILTVIFCGGLTSPLLGLLKIPVGVTTEDGGRGGGAVGGRGEEGREGDGTDSDNVESQADNGQVLTKSYLARSWKSLDGMLMKPLLTNCQPTLMETMSYLGPVSRWLTTNEQMAANYITREGDAEQENVCYSREPDTLPVVQEHTIIHGD